jgi:hypothetical protein
MISPARTAQSADDALGGGAFQAERCTDSEHPLADLQAVGITEGHGRQPGGVDFQQGDVGLWVAADDLGRKFALVVQPDGDFFRPVHDVMVGDEIAVGGNDEAGTESLNRHALAATGHRRQRKLLEERRERVVFIILIREALHDRGRRFLAGDRDVHHRRRISLDQRAEIGDGHFHPNRFGSRGGPRRRQGACCQNRAAGRQNHRRRQFLDLARELHRHNLSRNVIGLRGGTVPAPTLRTIVTGHA